MSRPAKGKIKKPIHLKINLLSEVFHLVYSNVKYSHTTRSHETKKKKGKKNRCRAIHPELALCDVAIFSRALHALNRVEKMICTRPGPVGRVRWPTKGWKSLVVFVYLYV